ncbi:hypothetical protein SUGI_0814870 [Cryptomeria japonica]|nr:hypothetical protein SUGI_0814870 [Cryptomeria japonica]
MVMTRALFPLFACNEGHCSAFFPPFAGNLIFRRAAMPLSVKETAPSVNLPFGRSDDVMFVPRERRY